MEKNEKTMNVKADVNAEAPITEVASAEALKEKPVKEKTAKTRAPKKAAKEKEPKAPKEKAPKAPKEKAPKAPKEKAVKEKAPKEKAPKASARRRITFAVTAAPGSEVYLAGSFNGWATKERRLKFSAETGDYRTIILLEPGRYEYKFIINDIWELDNSNPNFVPNGFNSFNSVIVVEE